MLRKSDAAKLRVTCITAESYGEIILDENIKAPADCKLRLWDEKTCFTD